MFRNFFIFMIIIVNLVVSSVYAQDVPQETKITLQQLLERVKQGRVTDNASNKKREEIFRSNRNKQQTLLNNTKADIAKEEVLSERLENVFNEQERKLAELEGLLNERLGVFNELFGIVRQVAGEMKAQVNESIISGELAGRDVPLKILSKNKDLPTIRQLEGLWYALQQEMTAQGEVKTFSGKIVGQDGITKNAEIIRVGPFTAFSDGQFLRYSEKGVFIELGRQPPARFRDAAENLADARDGELVKAVLDPSRGAILDLFIQTPNLRERIHQGGLVGYIIIAFGIVGIFMAFLRIFQLVMVERTIKEQLVENVPSGNNPLGRIWKVYVENDSVDVETLELKLDDAILKETPMLERGLSLIKLIAGVAPLLGLLGTVTGMILTFQAITLFGTGDPKLMAGGISQALITTVLGLCVAIPTLLLYSLAASRSKEVIQILEEQVAGLIAEHAEKISSASWKDRKEEQALPPFSEATQSRSKVASEKTVPKKPSSKGKSSTKKAT